MKYFTQYSFQVSRELKGLCIGEEAIWDDASGRFWPRARLINEWHSSVPCPSAEREFDQTASIAEAGCQ